MIVSKKNRFLSERGVTLLETLVVVGMGTVLTLGMGMIMKSFSRAKVRIEDQLTGVGDEFIGNRQIWFDLRQAGISFNFISQAATPCPASGTADFYDYLPDTTCRPTTGEDIDDNHCTRRLFLSVKPGYYLTTDPANPSNRIKKSEPAPVSEVILALSLKGAVGPTPLSPLVFYASTPAPDLSTSGTLTMRTPLFTGNTSAPGLLDTLSTAYKPNLKPGAYLIRFYSPIALRPLASSGGSPNINTPPRMMSLVGVATVDASFNIRNIGTTLPVPPSGWLKCQRHPSILDSGGNLVDLGQAATPENMLDRFFRLLPPVGGRHTFAMASPIEVVKYSLAPAKWKNKDTHQLLRSKWDAKNARWGEPHMVAMGVKSIEFYRKSISVPSIKATVAMDDTVSDADKGLDP